MKRLSVILLAVFVLFTLCCGAEETELEALRAENARLKQRLDAYTDPGVIAVFNGGTVTFGEVYAEYAEIEEYSRYISGLMGEEYSVSEAEAFEMQQVITQNLITEKLIQNYIDAQGITLITPEAEAEIRVRAQGDYELLLEEYAAYYTEEGLEAEQARREAAGYMEANGMGLEEIISSALERARSEAVITALAGEVTVTRADIEAAYEVLTASDREYYGEYPEEYAYDALYSEAVITYVPEGYRLVQTMLIPFSEADMARYDELLLKGESYGEEAEKLFEALKPEADGVYNRLLSGESWDVVFASYSSGAEYLNAVGRPEGCPVSEGCFLFDDATLEKITALTEIGQFTSPVATDWGWAIFRYAGNIQSGDRPLDEIYDYVYETAYASVRSERYDEALNKLKEDADIVCFYERLN